MTDVATVEAEVEALVAMTSKLIIDRKEFASALCRLAKIVTRTRMGALRNVLLQQAGDWLVLTVTDLDTYARIYVQCEGELPKPVLVNCERLVRAVKLSTDSECKIWSFEDQLIANGGTIEHRLPLELLKDYPPVDVAFQVPDDTPKFVADPQVMASAFRTGMCAASRENTRYAITGLFINPGKRIVEGTDGRRLVHQALFIEPGDKPVLPLLVASSHVRAVLSMIDKSDRHPVHVYGTPTRDAQRGGVKEKQTDKFWFAGPDWIICGGCVDGSFPDTNGIVPTGKMRFRVERTPFIEALVSVMSAASPESKGVRLSFKDKLCTLSCRDGSGGEATASVRAVLLIDGDAGMDMGFNPAFLLDCFKTIEDAFVEFDQEAPNRPARITGSVQNLTTWTLMPVNLQ